MSKLDIISLSSVGVSILLAMVTTGCAEPEHPTGMTEADGAIKQLPRDETESPGPFSNAFSNSSSGHQVYCDYNGSSIYMPGDTSTDLICIQCYDPFGTPAVDWSYDSTDGRLNSWGWYLSGGAVNWGMCLNPQGAAPDYYLNVGMRLHDGSAGPWFVNAIPCKKPSWW